MLKLSLRQMKMLDCILRCGDTAEPALIAASAGISERTLSDEVRSLNSALKQEHASVVCRRGRGYRFVCDDEGMRGEMQSQCAAYLDSSLLGRYGENPRVFPLLLQLLCTPEYVRAEDLADEMGISATTLTKDLKAAREVLGEYGIEIRMRPYHGMWIAGSGSSVRSCLIDCFGLYDCADSRMLFSVDGLELFCLSEDRRRSVRADLVAALARHGLHLKQQGFLRLLRFAVIAASGKLDGLAQAEIPEIYGSPVMECAKDLVSAIGAGDAEAGFIYLILMGGLEDDEKLEVRGSGYEVRTDKAMERVFCRVREQCGLDLGRTPNICSLIRGWIFQAMVVQDGGARFLDVSVGALDAVRKMPASFALSLAVAEAAFGAEQAECRSFDPFLADLTIRLFNLVFLVPNEYRMTRVAVLGGYSALTSSGTIYRLNATSRYNLHYDYFPAYEKDAIDFGSYDCVIAVAGKGMHLHDCPLPVYQADFFMNDSARLMRRLFDEVLVHHRVVSVSIDSRTEASSMTCCAGDAQSCFSEMADMLSAQGMDREGLDSCLETMARWRTSHLMSHSLVLCLPWRSDLASKLYRFEMAAPLLLEGHEIRSIEVAVLCPHESIVSIKQADSYVRRMQGRLDDGCPSLG